MAERQWYYKLVDGKPVPTDMWGWADDREKNRRVGLDHVGPMKISTVWLGLDHAYGDGPALLWETMIFGIGDDEEYCERYASEEEAVAGHAQAITFAKMRLATEQPATGDEVGGE